VKCSLGSDLGRAKKMFRNHWSRHTPVECDRTPVPLLRSESPSGM